MGTKLLSSKDVKQLVGFDECVCLPLPDNSQGQVGVLAYESALHLCLLLTHASCNCMNNLQVITSRLPV